MEGLAKAALQFRFQPESSNFGVLLWIYQSLCSDNPPWCHLCMGVTGHKGPWVSSHPAMPTLSFVTVKSRNAGGKEEAGKENEEKREEGEHFYTLNWHDDTVVGLD